MLLKNLIRFALAHLIVLFMSMSSGLANFGNGCILLPVSPDDNYLQSSTAYGHIINSIDMTTYVTGACDVNNPQFTFCIRNATGSNVCTPVTMNVGDSKPLSSFNNNPDLGGNPELQNIALTVSIISNNMCLTMPTSRGPLPVACKATTIKPPVAVEPKVCSNISNICYGGGTHSQSLLNFSGTAIYCLKETLDMVFYQQSACAIDPSSIQSILLSPFPSFQASLQNAVLAALIMYVMFFGFKIIMNTDSADLNNIAMFLAKFLLVSYFAIGLGPIFIKQGQETTHNGVTEFALPFLAGATANFASIVFNAGQGNGLCQFDATKYQPGYENYSIWDSIDCRVGYYLGMQLLYNNDGGSNILGALTSNAPTGTAGGTPINLGAPGTSGINALKMIGGLPFFSVMFGFFMGGNLIIVVAGFIFAIVFISILLHFISTYLVCLVTLYVMCYISPIFVTFALFTKTKPYFDAWLKVVIACALQPAIIAGFIAILLTTYDTAIFGNCAFQRHDYTIGNNNFSTFELQLPASDTEQCTSSAGYILLQYYNGQGWISKDVILFPIYYILDIFFLLGSLIYVLVFTILFYFFSKSISQFASDITNGPGMSSVTANPTKVMNQAMKAAEKGVALAIALIRSGGSPTALAQAAAKEGAKAAMEAAKDMGESAKRAGGEKAGDGAEGGEAKDSIASGEIEGSGGGGGAESFGGGGGSGAGDKIGK